MEELKAEGKIRAFGVSINDHQPGNALRLIETGVVDTVQVIYNVFDQSPEDALLETCARRGVGVIVRVPFDEGALTGAVTPDTTFPETALRYILSRPEVSTVIPGMRSVRNVERNVAAGDGQGLPTSRCGRCGRTAGIATSTPEHALSSAAAAAAGAGAPA